MVAPLGSYACAGTSVHWWLLLAVLNAPSPTEVSVLYRLSVLLISSPDKDSLPPSKSRCMMCLFRSTSAAELPYRSPGSLATAYPLLQACETRGEWIC